ncbi:MAG: SpoIIE family protein phosphatase [Angelakisella sp.]
MQGVTEFTGLKISQRLEQLVTAGSYPVLCCCYAVGGAVAALAKIVGGGAPFGVAWLAAIPFRFTLPSTLGVLVGYLAGLGFTGSWHYLAAALLVSVLRWLLRPQRWAKQRLWLTPLTAGAAVFAAGVLPALYHDPLVYDIILWLTQIVIAAAAAAFLERALLLVDGHDRTNADDTALWVLLSIAIMGLSTLQLSGVSLGRIFAAGAVLFAARAGGVVPATMTGVICGFAAGFTGGSFTLYVTLYSLGGLMAGLFSIFGRVGSAVAFTAAYGFIGMLAGGSGIEFVEVAMAGILFLMLPQGWVTVFAATIAPREGSTTVKTLVAEQLTAASAALRDVAGTTAEVAAKLNRRYTGDISGIYDRAGDTVCRRCAYAGRCWQEQYTDTVDALAHGLRHLMIHQTLSVEDFPEQFGYCLNKGELVQFLATESDRYSRKDEQRRRAAQTRRLLADQLEGVALALGDMEQQLEDISGSDSIREAKIEALLAEQRLEPVKVICWQNRLGRLSVLAEIPEYKESRCQVDLLTRELGALLERPLAFPVVTRRNKVSRMVFCERPRYALEYGSCQLCCGTNPVCGDSFRILGGSTTTANLLLCDGMGSGNSAAVDSAMAASLLSKLLGAGLDYPAALKLMNGSLLAKSGDESLATVDAAQIDLYTGRVCLYKAGAAPTVVRKGGKGIEIASTSLPAGILEGVEFAESHLTLEDGDLLLLLSDGAVPDSSDWIARCTESFDNGDLDAFCRKLATGARLRRTDGKDDDITVLCCRLTLVPRER